LNDLKSLLRLSPWLRTKRPAHAFVLSRGRLTYVGPEPPSRSAKGIPPTLRVLSRPLPEDAFVPGPAGIPLAAPSLAGAAARLLAEAAVKMPAAALVVPDDFVHVLVVDVEEPERHAKEVEEILTWKFGRTFGEPVPPLRLSWQEAGPGASGTRVVALTVPEEAAASWEAPFERAGIRIGAVEIESLAVSSLGSRSLSGDGLVVWAHGATASVAYFEKGSLRFLRVRTASDTLSALQEVRLTASYVAPPVPSTGDASPESAEPPLARIPCAAGPYGEPVVDAFLAFRAESGGAPVVPLSLEALLPGTRVASGRANGSDVLAALGAMAGGD
jgi:hypothetical protein